MNPFKSRIIHLILLGFGLSLGIAGCDEGSGKVPLDDVLLEMQAYRLDQKLHEAAQALQANPALDSLALYSQFLSESRAFVTDWIFLGNADYATDSVVAGVLTEFVSDSIGQVLLGQIQSQFAQKDPLDGVENLLKRLKYYFPNRTMPSIVTFADGFPPTVQAGLEQTFMSPRFIGIGLHYFMGPDFNYYPPDMPQYLRRRTDPAYIPVHIAYRIAEAMIPAPELAGNPVLLDHVVQQGMQQLLVDKLLEDSAPDSVKLFYTADQLDWANSFEARAYKDLVNDFYDIDSELVRRYIDDSPFTSQLHRSSAPRLGRYMGWKILQAYEQKHPEVSLEELVLRRDFQKVFKEAGYRPPS